LKLISLLHNAGADVAYHDPHVASSRRTGCRCTRLPTSPPPTTASSSPPDHHSIDYAQLVDDASLVVDLRNATGAKGTASDKVFKL